VTASLEAVFVNVPVGIVPDNDIVARMFTNVNSYLINSTMLCKGFDISLAYSRSPC
jgi:hypothetical protein